jgi:GT2 family glycosyltransferase/2-polyprenyl-3-methyl-5-hydroxy-6-metoxy-1,4-benzoquinol methylase/glycosyltransferase involved in cell wall biosynthesis
MTETNGQRHIYLRQMAQGERTSLSVLAEMVAPGSRVLDIGTGSGALGAWLATERGCVVDGLTINPAEAALAADAYRRIEVVDLEQPGWTARFGGERYDYIVCADVLEHLRAPERTLADCHALLAPEGQVLVSVPNAGYSGLVADLMQGDFHYRDEGLLDRTHLRFFTRRSITELVASQGYTVEAVEGIERPLNTTEFRTRFDELPPAVSRYLLAVPDAATYQLVLRARTGARPGAQPPASVPSAPAQALFTAMLYWDLGGGYREDHKAVAPGVIGAQRQVLRFTVPGGVARLRLDPADRPGFLHLHAMRLRHGYSTTWEWAADEAGLRQLESWRQSHMLVRATWPSAGGLLLLHGDDPWIELPLTPGQLPEAEDEGVLEVELSWPMSADYLALAGTVQPLADRIGHMQGQLAQAAEHAAAMQEQLRRQLQLLEAQVAETRGALEGARRHAASQEELRGQADAALQRAHDRLGEANAQLAQVSAQLEQATAQQQALQEQAAHARQRHAEQALELRRITQDKMNAQRDLGTLQKQYHELAEHLHWIERSTVFRATRPLVHAKMAVDRLLGRRAADPGPPARERRVEPAAHPVDVIVPVYRGLDDTRCCIESVLASQCRTPWRLIVLNDASPEPEVTQWLRDIAAREPRITLLENEHNLGFVGTVNRGMALGETNDVVLLNSDAEVANDWLDRLRAAAYRDERVASVTPFSNNATICSYPRFCEANELPPGWDTARLDLAFAQANPGEAVDVPTGVGFCMYIRRDCLAEVGLFDVEQFGKGYGEENDFCRRAADAGWRNLHALDTFVRHAGGVSFGESKSQREIEAVEKLRRLHPTYDRLVHEYVAADPPRAARLKADVARIAASGVPVVLAVLHNRGGGTHRHVLELARHLQGQVLFLGLLPQPNGVASLELLEPGSAFRLEFVAAAQWPALVDTLRALGVAHVHYHHVIGHDEAVLGLARELGVGWDFTTHDFFPICPNISLTGPDDRYCGEQGHGDCHRCAANAPGGDLAAWRGKHGALLSEARAVLSPSRDTARRMQRMWPGASVRWAPHTDIADPQALPQPQPAALDAAAPLRVAVLGGVSRIKGADVLEDVASLASREGAALEFHLLGHAYRNLRTQPHAALTVHGAYQEPDLPRLLAWLKPDLVWFPAQWPETYSYTLSACLEAGLPVVAPDLGAFAERLSGRRWSWIKPWDTTAADWLDFFIAAREQNFVRGTSPAPVFFAADALDARAERWHHEVHYAAGLKVQPVGQLPEWLLPHAWAAQPAGPPAGGSLKRLALASLVRLRSTRGFRRVARAIPAHVQRRVKNWLLA